MSDVPRPEAADYGEALDMLYHARLDGARLRDALERLVDATDACRTGPCRCREAMADARAALDGTSPPPPDWVRCPHDDAHSMTGGLCDICQLPRPDRVPEGETVINGKRWRVEPHPGWETFDASDGMPGMRVRDDLYRLVPTDPEGEQP